VKIKMALKIKIRRRSPPGRLFTIFAPRLTVPYKSMSFSFTHGTAGQCGSKRRGEWGTCPGPRDFGATLFIVLQPE